MTEIIPIYEKRFQIPSYLVDDRSQLTVSSLFSLLQEVSDSHATQLGAGWHALRDRGYFWVLTRMRLKITRLPEWTEPVLIRSWVRKSEAATSPRDYELVDAAGNVLVAGSSVWAILDTAEARPQRMSIFDGMFLPQDRCAINGKPPKIGPVALPDMLPGAKEVVSSDIDMNHHVNNARYIQWAFDAVEETFRQTHCLADVTVNFISQAKLGDRYVVCSEPLSETAFKTAILSADGQTTFCRLQTEWE